MSGRYRVPFLSGNTRYRDHQMWPPVEQPLFGTIVGQASGLQPITVNYWGLKGLTLDQLIAITWRVKAWQLSGSWGFTDHYDTPLPSNDVTFNQTLDTIVKYQFATYDNDLITSHHPLTNEPLLISESFGPTHTPKNYIHDFAAGLGGSFNGLHSFGGRFDAATDQQLCNTVITDNSGTTNYNAPNGGQINLIFLRDFESFASFNQSRGADMVKFTPAGTGPSGPPLSFDVLFKLNAQPPGALLGSDGFVYTNVADASVPANATIVVDPGIVTPINVDAVVGSPGTTSTPGITRTSQHCNLKLTAVEFFEYCDSTGQPIWDALTGAQLRDPFG